MFNSFYQNLVPTGNINSLNVLQISQTSIRIMWEEVDCDQRNGRIIEYIVIISNNSNTYNLTSTERYITVNDLVLGGIYSISVAAVNSIGISLFKELQIVTSKILFIHHNYTVNLISIVTTFDSSNDGVVTTVGLSTVISVLAITLIISNVSLILYIIK